MTWQMVKLSQIVSDTGIFSDGDWIESKDQNPDGHVRLVQLADIGVGRFINKSNRFMTEESAEKLKCTYLKEGDILVARMPDPIGRACIFPSGLGKCVTVVDICIIRPNSKDIYDKWLMHLINSNMFNNQINQHVTGTTRQRISRGNLAKLKIPLPPLEEQKRIAAILDKADAIRRKRQQAIDLADEFLRSVFLDMFGDPVNKGWDWTTVEELADSAKGSMRTGPFGSDLKHSEFVDSGIAVLGIDNAVLNRFTWGKERFITSDKYEALKRYTVKSGDVIITIMGTCGRCAVVPDDIPLAVNTKHLCCITLDKNKCLPEFLHSYFLMHPAANQYLRARAKGAIMDGLNLGMIKELSIPIVPISLQTKYVDVSKSVYKSLEKLNISIIDQSSLFSSLSQKAFSGEL